MIGILHSVRNICALTIACIFLTSVAHSATFTAVASGNWSAAATWGAAAPNFTNTADQITIPAGITVTMDNNVTMNGLLASLAVAGTLTSNATTTFTVTQGIVSGSGAINVGTMTLGAASLLAFTGTVTAENLTSASTAIQAAADITVTKSLNLTGGVLSIATDGTLSLADDATVVVSGGLLALNGGLLALTNSYNVRYTTAAAITGLELTGSGLKNVIIDVPAGMNVVLGNSLTIAQTGALTLTSGNLSLNGLDLTVNGAFNAAANAGIISTSASSIAINSTAGIVGALNFNGINNAVKNLTVNVGATATSAITGAVEVTNALQLTSGTLRFVNSTLTLSGSVSGAGTLAGDATSNLVVNTTGGLSNALNFAVGSQMINSLTTNVGAGNVVKLGSNLAVSGATALASGNLDISNVTLTLGGALTGAGTIVSNATSGLTINTPGGLTSPISFTGNTIGSLGINVGNGGTVSLGSSLSVMQDLALTSGTLALNGNDLTIAGDIAAAGTGSVQSTVASAINFTSTAGTTGALTFSGVANAVKSLSVNVGDGMSAAIQGALTVADTLNLQSGALRIAGSTLTIAGDVTGSGMLTGDTTANLVINKLGGLTSPLNFAVGGQTINNLTTNVGAGNSVKLGTDLVVSGTTTLTSGKLDISDVDLTIGGALTGAGTVVSNANSGLTISTPGGLASPVTVTGGTIGAFGVNVGTGNTVTLGSNLSVLDSLNLTSGTLNLNNFDLTLAGNVVGGINGFVQSTAASDINLTSVTGMTGALNFAANSAVGTLLTDVGATNTARIAGDLDVMTALDIASGTLDFSNADLTIGGMLNGTDSLAGNAASNLTINTIGGLVGGLRFTQAGQTINNLTVNVGAGNTVTLLSDLVVNGTTSLTSGSLVINNVDLTLNGTLNGVGTIATNATSGLTLNQQGTLSTALTFVGTTIGDLTVNAGSGGSASLGSDLNVMGVLDLESGTLTLNGNDLTISGVLDATGTGTISSSNTSNITLASTISSVRDLMFEATANVVNNLTIAADISADLAVGTDVTVEGVLTLTSGVLSIGDNVLTIGTDGSVIGGTITSYIETAVGGAVSMALDAGASLATTFPVGTDDGFFPATVNLLAGSASGIVNVGVRAGVLAQGTTGTLISATESAVNATWDVSSDISSNLKMSLETAWQQQAEVNGFNRAQAYISHYTSGSWDASAMASATARADGMFSLTRDDIESLSPFAVFDATTSDVAEDELASNYNVFPSPATDVVVIENHASASTPMTVDIVDAQGRIVASTVMTGANVTISVSNLSTGIYFIQMHNATSNVTKSFMKI